MSAAEFIIIFVLSGILGFVTQHLLGFKVGGLLVCVILGFAGGALGTWLAHALRLPRMVSLRTDWTYEDFPIVWCILGTVLVMAVVASIQRSREKEKYNK